MIVITSMPHLTDLIRFPYKQITSNVTDLMENFKFHYGPAKTYIIERAYF